MTTTFGEMNWNDKSLDSTTGGNRETNKDLFLRLVEGNNELRLITAPFQYLVHKYKKDPTDKKDYGQKVLCSSIHGSCAVCATGDQAKLRWLFGVIDRKTGQPKILDVGGLVMEQLKENARNPKIGEPTKYDINIFVNKKGGPAGYYKVQTYQREPLSAEDQKMRDEFDINDLKRRVTPLSPEKVQERLDKIHGNAAPRAPLPPTVNVTDDEDIDEEFPAFPGSSA